MGKFCVFELREWQAKSHMHVWLPGQAHGGAGIAVVCHSARDDLGALRLSDRVPIIPGELDRGVVRLRTRALEDDAGHGDGRDPKKFLRQHDGRFGRAMPIEVVVAKLTHLLVGDLGEPLRAEAQCGAPQPRDCFDVLFAGVVENSAALAARNDERPIFLVRAKVRLHVYETCHVACLDRIRDVGHLASSEAAVFCSISTSTTP